MWKACSSEVRFSMVQSSTAPTRVTMLGGSLARKLRGRCPSTVRKNGKGGLVPWAASEKYSFRTSGGLIAANPENRGVTICAGVAAGATAAADVWPEFEVETTLANS